MRLGLTSCCSTSISQRGTGGRCWRSSKGTPTSSVFRSWSSQRPKRKEDALRAYNPAADCYVTKPVECDEFLKLIQNVEDLWLAIVALPPA